MKNIKSSIQEKIVFLKLRSGDSDAFAFFYDKYVTKIYRFVFFKVSSKQVAEDLTQDIFLKIWQYLVDKKHIKSFEAFIFRIARNTVIDYYRKASRQELPLEHVVEKDDDTTEDLITSLDQSLETTQLLEKIKSLKPEYQEVLLLRYVEDLSIEDISQVIEKDKNNTRVTIHRALEKLKRITNNK